MRFAPAHAGTVSAILTAAGKKPAATATVALTGTGALGAAPGHLYRTSAAGGTISEANLNGSSPRVLVASQRGAEGLAVDASHLYWTAAGEGVIYVANLDGTNPQALVSGQNGPWGVAADPSGQQPGGEVYRRRRATGIRMADVGTSRYPELHGGSSE